MKASVTFCAIVSLIEGNFNSFMNPREWILDGRWLNGRPTMKHRKKWEGGKTVDISGDVEIISSFPGSVDQKMILYQEYVNHRATSHVLGRDISMFVFDKR